MSEDRENRKYMNSSGERGKKVWKTKDWQCERIHTLWFIPILKQRYCLCAFVHVGVHVVNMLVNGPRLCAADRISIACWENPRRVQVQFFIAVFCQHYQSLRRREREGGGLCSPCTCVFSPRLRERPAASSFLSFKVFQGFSDTIDHLHAHRVLNPLLYYRLILSRS